MKGLTIPAVLTAVVAGYLGVEGIRLSVSGVAFASAGLVVAGQAQEGHGSKQTLFNNKSKGVDMPGDSEMMEFEGDVFADVPEHMTPGDKTGEESKPAEDFSRKNQG